MEMIEILITDMEMIELVFVRLLPELWWDVGVDISDIDRQMLVEGDMDGGKVSDVLMGTCEVPLSSLLTHRTGMFCLSLKDTL